MVPTDTTNYEDGLFKEAHRVKKKLSRVVLPPARDRVFTDCRMMIVVMDEGRHTDGVLMYNCQHLMKDFFKFYREGGKVNKNVLRSDRDKGETSSKTGEVWCLSETQFSPWLNFLGSPMTHVPVGDP